MEVLRLIKIEAQTEQLQETGRNWLQTSSPRQQFLWGLLPMKQETHLCPHESPRVGLALIFRPGLCVNGQTPARCLHLPESEPLWRAGRGFVVRDLPWTAEKLRAGLFHTFKI